MTTKIKNVFRYSYFPSMRERLELMDMKKELMLDDEESYDFIVSHLELSAQEAIRSIFSPGVHEPKSVLLKRGNILLDGMREQEILLFTGGFVLVNTEFDSTVDTLIHSFSHGSPTGPLKLTSDQLRDRFNQLDLDGSRYLEYSEIQVIFQDIGVPVSNETIYKIIRTFDANSDGKISFSEFESTFRRHEICSHWRRRSSGGKTFWGLGKKQKNRSKMEPTNDELHMLHDAFQLCDVDSVEGLDATTCHHYFKNPPSSDTDLEHCFAIYIKGRETPLIVECIDAIQCDEWKKQFRACFENTRRGKRITDTHGWKKQESIDWGDLDDELSV